MGTHYIMMLLICVHGGVDGVQGGSWHSHAALQLWNLQWTPGRGESVSLLPPFTSKRSLSVYFYLLPVVLTFLYFVVSVLTSQISVLPPSYHIESAVVTGFIWLFMCWGGWSRVASGVCCLGGNYKIDMEFIFLEVWFVWSDTHSSNILSKPLSF